MKPEEAIDGLRYMISGGCTDSHWDFIDEIELAIEALEKQIPKKINYIAIPHCSCGCVIGRTDNYCRTCGQAVKRGE